MAYVDENLDEDEGQGGQGSGEVVTSTGTGGTVPSGGNQGSSQSAQGDDTASSTGWTNLQNYITANQGQAGRMAETVTGKIGETAEAATQGKETLSTNVRSDVDKGTVRDQGVISGLESDPTKVSKEAYQTQRDASYGGPTDLSSYNEYAEVQKNIGQLSQQLANTESEGGRRALLKETYDRPDYGYGMQAIDSYIINASPESQQQIAATKDQYGGLASDWDKTQQDLTGYIGQGRATTEKTAADTKAAWERLFGGASEQVGAAKTQADQVNTARDARFQSLTNRLSSSDPTVRASAYKEAGIDPAIGDYLLSNGVSPQQILRDSGDVGIGNYLDPQTAARFAALSALEDRAVNLDLGRRGALEDFTLNRQALTQGARAKQIRDEALALVEQRNRERDAAYEEAARRSLNQFKGELGGLTNEQIKAIDLYGNKYGNIVERGQALDTGDVLTDQQRQEWADIVNALGLTDTFKYQDTQDEGGAYRISDTAKQRAVDMAVKDYQAKLEQERLSRTPEGQMQNYANALGPQIMTQLEGLSPQQQVAMIKEIEAEARGNPEAQAMGAAWVSRRIEEKRKSPVTPYDSNFVKLGSLGNAGINI